MKELKELLSGDSVWPKVEAWLEAAANPLRVLPPNPDSRDNVLLPLQVTTQSTMGVIVYETGGLLVDHGWLRILGSGHPDLPRDIVGWNRLLAGSDEPTTGLLYIADDVLGGLFAMNGGALPGKLGDVSYFAPDTLQWESLELGYTAFISWVLDGDMTRFYDDHRWEAWKEEIAEIDGDSAVSVYPFLFADGPPIGERSRKKVPMAELVGLMFTLRAGLLQKSTQQ